MSAEDRASICARVLDGLVDRGDVGGDPELTEHLGSCMACFRVLSELRDVPRIAELLRSDPPPLPQSDRFWNELAARTTDAAAAARMGSKAAGSPRPRRRFRGRVLVLATSFAATAGFLLASHRPYPLPPSAAHAPVASVTSVRSLPDEETGEVADVADLDGKALRRLVDRLRAAPPARLTAPVGGDSAEGADLLADDDVRVNDELADLDTSALLRVASSLGRSSL